jgi:hypothetical protein
MPTAQTPALHIETLTHAPQLSPTDPAWLARHSALQVVLMNEGTADICDLDLTVAPNAPALRVEFEDHIEGAAVTTDAPQGVKVMLQDPVTRQRSTVPVTALAAHSYRMQCPRLAPGETFTITAITAQPHGRLGLMIQGSTRNYWFATPIDKLPRAAYYEPRVATNVHVSGQYQAAGVKHRVDIRRSVANLTRARS